MAKKKNALTVTGLKTQLARKNTQIKNYAEQLDWRKTMDAAAAVMTPITAIAAIEIDKTGGTGIKILDKPVQRSHFAGLALKGAAMFSDGYLADVANAAGDQLLVAANTNSMWEQKTGRTVADVFGTATV